LHRATWKIFSPGPKAFNPSDQEAGEPALTAYYEVASLLNKSDYTDPDKSPIRDHVLTLDISYRNAHGAVRRRRSQDPTWARLRKNRGSFDRQPADVTKDVEIAAHGRGDWI